MEERESDSANISTLRKWIIWAAVTGTALWTGYFFAFLVYQSIVGSATSDNWFIKMVQEHPAATIGVAMSAISAFCIVAILEISRGAIEFEALGFKFRGASGPVVLWVFCFLVMIFGVWLLWDKSNTTLGETQSFRPSYPIGEKSTSNDALRSTTCHYPDHCG